MQNITLYVTLVSDKVISRQLDEAKMLMTPVLVPRGINVVFAGDNEQDEIQGIEHVELEFHNTDTLIYDIILELSVRFNYRLYDVIAVGNSEIYLEGERIALLDNVIYFGCEEKILRLRKKIKELAPFDEEGVQIPLLRKQLSFLEIMFLNYDFVKRLKGHSSNPIIDESAYSNCLLAYETFFSCNLEYEESIEKGESCFVKALEVCSAIEDTVAELHILKFYAEFLILCEKFDKACTLLERYFSLYENTDVYTNPVMGHHKVCSLNCMACARSALKEYDVSVEFFQQAARASEEYFGKNHPDTIQYLDKCSNVLEFLARFSDAMDVCVKILEMTEVRYGKNTVQYAVRLNNIGVNYLNNAEYGEALKYFKMSVKFFENFPKNYTDTLCVIYRNISCCNLELGHIDAAKKYALKCCSIAEGIYGQDSEEVAECYKLMGRCHYAADCLHEALACYWKALPLLLRKYGDKHRSLMVVYSNMSNCYLQLANYGKAHECLLKTLSIQKELYGDMHVESAATYNKLGVLCKETGDLQGAIENYKKALQIRRENLREFHPDISNVLTNMGEYYLVVNDLENAYECFYESIDILIKNFGQAHGMVRNLYVKMAVVYRTMDKLDAAMELLQKAYKFAVEDGGDSNYELSHILFEMSEICRVEGEYDQALEYMFRVLELEQKQYGIFHPNAAVAQAAISLILLENGVSDKALYYCLMAMDTFRKAYGEQHTEMAFCYHLLGSIYETRGDYGMSMENYMKAFIIRKNILGEDHPKTVNSYEAYIQAQYLRNPFWSSNQ